MSPKQWSWLLVKTIPSSIDDGHRLIDELNLALEAAKWDGRDLFHVQMAVEEAIVNAIEHGNKRNENKKVDVDFRVAEDEVRIAIVDEGDGFDPAALPDPTDDELLEKPRGRGVMLMKELMSEVEYNDKGNSVFLLKRRAKE